MPPLIALALCFVFIAFLFISDYREEQGISGALWIPIIWFLIIGSRPVSIWLNMGLIVESPDDYLEGSPLDRIIFGILIAAGLITLLMRRIRFGEVIRKNKWIFIYIIYGGMSILWSDYTFVSFKRWIKEIGNLIMILIVLTDYDAVQAVRILMKRFAYALIPLSIILIKYFPEFGRQYDRWTGHPFYQGVGGDKNALGYLCLLCGFFFVWELLTFWKRKILFIEKKALFISAFMLASTCWLMLKAQSSTSLAALMGGSFFLGVFGIDFVRKGERRVDFLVIIGILVSLIAFLGLDLGKIVVIALGRDETLTGRTDLWKILIDMVTSPVIGVGYESFWLGDRATGLWAKYWFRPNEAHNGYLEVYLNLGAIGLFFLAGIIIDAYRRSRKELVDGGEFGRFRMGFLGATLLYAISEAAFRVLSPVWFMFLLIATERPERCVVARLDIDQKELEKKYLREWDEKRKIFEKGGFSQGRVERIYILRG